MGEYLTESTTGNAELFCDCLEENYYMQYVDKPTRGDNVLDLIIKNEPDLVSDVRVIEHLANSDHGMITWRMNLENGNVDTARSIYDYNRADFENMRRELNMVDWNEFFVGDVSTDWSGFRDLLQGLEEKYVPVRKEGSKGERKKAIWITRKAVKAIGRKRKVY